MLQIHKQVMCINLVYVIPIKSSSSASVSFKRLRKKIVLYKVVQKAISLS